MELTVCILFVILGILIFLLIKMYLIIKWLLMSECNKNNIYYKKAIKSLHSIGFFKKSEYKKMVEDNSNE